ncbi:uncharacterized protein HKW66_Vig0028200 [Vigna angularis]|uniref:Uncharacterized protein n=1 Tax=Phaseolus angularis TaxID=3914 RepID=A0A8T0LB00_PHAAN|nr:uncharacterized protein HKW66_Vig0028200 [Vigna angularis]
MDLLTFFQNALHNPTLLQQITRKIQSMDLLVYNKKRRLPPRLDDRDHVAGNTFVECFGTEYGNVSHHEFFETAKTFYALFESFQTQSSKFKLRLVSDQVQRGHDSFDVTADLHNRARYHDRACISSGLWARTRRTSFQSLVEVVWIRQKIWPAKERSPGEMEQSSRSFLTGKGGIGIFRLL